MIAFWCLLIFGAKTVKSGGYGYGDYNGYDQVPKPIMTIHEGHIGLNDQLMMTEYSGTIRAGQPYTLDIYMGNTDRYDYVIEKCFYNSKLTFLDNYGCLRKDNVFQEKWETNQYTISGALKRTLIYFVAPEPAATFDCQIKVIECCGCAEQSCERQPIFTAKTYQVPLMCSYPQTLPYGGGSYPYGYGSGYWGNRGSFWDVIPWWLWLLLLFLLLLLLLLIVCALCFCLMKKRGSQTSRGKTYPPAPMPPPIAPKPQTKTDGAVQTAPEMKQIGQQVNMDKKKRIEEDARQRRVDEDARQRQMSSYDALSLVDYNPKPEPKTVVHTIYSNEEHQYRDHRDRHYNLDQEYVNMGSPSPRNYRNDYEDERRQEEYRRYGGVPLHRGASHYQQQQLQHEIEEHMRREQERQELEERIESHLSEHRERRRYEASPSGETLREETIRTLRQSSVI